MPEPNVIAENPTNPSAEVNPAPATPPAADSPPAATPPAADSTPTPPAPTPPPASKPEHPETVPWSQYVGTKESITKQLNEAQEQVRTLTEQNAGLVKPEDLQAAVQRAEAAEQALHTSNVNAVINTYKITDAVVIAEIKGYSPSQLEVYAKGLASAKGLVDSLRPAADLGSGGGGTEIADARGKISAGWDAIHPTS